MRKIRRYLFAFALSVLCSMCCSAQLVGGDKHEIIISFGEQGLFLNNKFLHPEMTVKCSIEKKRLKEVNLFLLDWNVDCPCLRACGDSIPHAGDVYMINWSFLSDNVVENDSVAGVKCQDRLYEVVFVNGLINIKEPELSRVNFDKRLFTYAMLDDKQKAELRKGAFKLF